MNINMTSILKPQEQRILDASKAMWDETLLRSLDGHISDERLKAILDIVHMLREYDIYAGVKYGSVLGNPRKKDRIVETIRQSANDVLKNIKAQT